MKRSLKTSGATPAVKSDSPLPEAIIVDFPLREEWVALNSPKGKGHQTNFFAQTHAIDFAQLRGPELEFHSRDFLDHLLGRIPSREAFGWGQTVFSPVNGTVVEIGDNWPDRANLNLIRDLIDVYTGGFNKFRLLYGEKRCLLGNHIIIEFDRAFVLMAHLRCGSFLVKLGDRVRTDTPVGEIGNSGNSMTPHLHFQLMDDANIWQAKGIPCHFRVYERFQEGEWWRQENNIPGDFDLIRSCV